VWLEVNICYSCDELPVTGDKVRQFTVTIEISVQIETVIRWIEPEIVKFPVTVNRHFKCLVG
jgi:hypothetical protein